MGEEAQFRNAAWGSFNKEDVLRYIEMMKQSALETNMKLDQATRQLQDAQRRVQVLEAQLTCQAWSLLKQPFQSLVCQSNHVLLAVWIRSILSFRCQVVYLSQPWRLVKQVRLTLPSLPSVSYQ